MCYLTTFNLRQKVKQQARANVKTRKIPIAECLLRIDTGIRRQGRWPCASTEESSGFLKHLQGSDQPNMEYLTADYNYNLSMDGLSGH